MDPPPALRLYAIDAKGLWTLIQACQYYSRIAVTVG